jgi:transposase
MDAWSISRGIIAHEHAATESPMPLCGTTPREKGWWARSSLKRGRQGEILEVPPTRSLASSGKAWIEQHLGWSAKIVQHAPHDRGEWRYTRDETGTLQGEFIRFAPEPKKGFKGVMARRWVVERTFSWFGQSRRLSNDNERLPETSEALIYLTMSHITLKRLARS